MKVLKVKTPHTYPIYIGRDLIAKLPHFIRSFKSKSAFIVSDIKLTATRRRLIQTLKAAGWTVTEFPVMAGETFKDFKTIYPLYGKLIAAGARRDSLLIALGGGSIGDAAGFIAATYLRGIAWVGIPTTLLAQVDSSVGGKTGLNHEAGKNLIGAFHQPHLVLCDLSTLKTLSKREIISGLGEAIKYGLIYDRNFFNLFKNQWQRALKLDEKVLEEIVFKSLKFKAQAVAQDERDLKGVREVLNFGHTFGHAIEATSHYQIFQHGEAVIWGMRFASALSLIRKKMTEEEFLFIDDFLRNIEVPALKHTTLTSLFTSMKTDKKMRQGAINFVLLRKVGFALSDNKVTETDLKNAAYAIGVWH